MQEPLSLEPAMVPIPAGPLLMGTPDERIQLMEERSDWFRDGAVLPNPARHDPRLRPASLSTEQPAQVVTLPTFEISRSPVTNVQMDVYYRETGRWAPWRWCEAGSHPEVASHPASEVAWKEAGSHLDDPWELRRARRTGYESALVVPLHRVPAGHER